MILSLYCSYQYWVFKDKSSFLALDKAGTRTHIYNQQESRNGTELSDVQSHSFREAAAWVNDCTGGDALQMGQMSPMELCATVLMVHTKAWEISSEVIISQNLVILPEGEKEQSWTTVTALTRREEPIPMLGLQLLKLSAATLTSV